MASDFAGDSGHPLPGVRYQDLAALGVASFVLACACLYLNRQPNSLADLWLADVLCAVALLGYRRSQWPLILVCCGAAEGLARLAFGFAPGLALVLVSVHLLQSVLAWALLARSGLALHFDEQPASTLQLILLCISLPPFVGAAYEAALLAFMMQEHFAQHMLAAYLGSAIGNTIFMPLLLLLRRASLRQHLANIHWVQLATLGALSLALTLLAQLYLAYPFIYSTAMLIGSALVLTMTELAVVLFLTGFVSCAMLAFGGFLPMPMTHFWQIGLIYLPLYMVLVPPFLLAASLNQARQREQARRAAADKMEAILRYAAEAIITSDEEGRIESFNQAAEQIYQWPEQEALGQNLAQLSSLHLPLVQLAQYQNCEVEQVRRDGGHFAAEIMTSSFEVAGTRKWITIVRDITERKRMDQLKNDFVSTVSHELRTPLTSIRGALGLLAGGVAGPLPEQAMKLVQISYNGSERLSRLINDLLDMQKLEAGKMDFNFAAHPLAGLLQDAVSAIQSYASQYRVEVRLPAVLPDLMLWVDADRMQQVLNNLLSNACKFSPAQGVVDVVLSTEKNPENEENRVRIAIVDHGPGIKEDFKLRMFQKFSQSDSSDTKAKGGTGLGLSIAKVIVEQMNGKLTYHSEAGCEPGCGTSFYIDLPIHQD